MVMAGAGYSGRQEHNSTHCLPNNVYEMKVQDSYGDGMCCDYGSGFIKLSVDNTVLMHTTNFTYLESFSFGDEVVPIATDPKPDLPPPVLTLTLQMDSYPWEISVSLTDVNSGAVFWSDLEFQAQQLHIESLELNPTGCYLFEIFDSYGDGLCCGGFFELSLDNALLLQGELFGSYASVNVNC